MKNEFYEYQFKLANEDLVKIAYFDLGKVKREARKSAKYILNERNISTETLGQYKTKIRQHKKEELKRKLKSKEDNYSLINFLIDLILYG